MAAQRLRLRLFTGFEPGERGGMAKSSRSGRSTGAGRPRKGAVQPSYQAEAKAVNPDDAIDPAAAPEGDAAPDAAATDAAERQQGAETATVEDDALTQEDAQQAQEAGGEPAEVAAAPGPYSAAGATSAGNDAAEANAHQPDAAEPTMATPDDTGQAEAENAAAEPAGRAPQGEGAAQEATLPDAPAPLAAHDAAEPVGAALSNDGVGSAAVGSAAAAGAAVAGAAAAGAASAGQTGRDVPTPLALPEKAPAQSGPGMFRPILGGVIAAGIGAGVALWLFPPGSQPGGGVELSALEARLATLEERPAAVTEGETFDPSPLEARLAALEGALAGAEAAEGGGALAPDLETRLAELEARAMPDTSGLEQRLTAVEERSAPELAQLSDRLTALEERAVPDLDPLATRLSALEEAVEAVSGFDPEPLVARIAALEAELPRLVDAAVAQATAEAYAALDAEAESVAASAEAVAAALARAEARSALGTLGLAADSGAPAPEAVAQLAEVTDLPPALEAFAEGVPTLGALQAAFPAAARAALAAAPPPEDAGAGDRLVNFLRNQTGARSLAPRDGDDADAILSRAEAALRAGDLAGVLDQTAALPGASRAALADWRARAETRIAALDALEDLSARLGQEQESH